MIAVDTTLEGSGYFELNGDSLTLGLPHPNELNSGALVQTLEVFKRKGSGYTDAGNQTYSSNFPDHAVHHYDATPQSCPNDFEPVWYREFLEANRRTFPE